MGKQSGGTRRSTPKSSSSAAEERDRIYKNIIDYINNPFGSNKYGSKEMDVWDSMSNAERELALMEGGFTGLMTLDELESNNLYYRADKKQLVGWLAEDISNVLSGYRMDDTNWTIGFKDGTIKDFGSIGNELGTLGVTSNQSFRTQQEKVASALSDRKINFIIRTDGYDQPRYYTSSKEGMKALKRYGGFEEWKNGRGEKRRDYIQDDWI